MISSAINWVVKLIILAVIIMVLIVIPIMLFLLFLLFFSVSVICSEILSVGIEIFTKLFVFSSRIVVCWVVGSFETL